MHSILIKSEVCMEIHVMCKLVWQAAILNEPHVGIWLSNPLVSCPQINIGLNWLPTLLRHCLHSLVIVRRTQVRKLTKNSNQKHAL
jgi:hypothetical protein